MEDGGVEGRSNRPSPIDLLVDALTEDAAPKIEVPGAKGGLPFKEASLSTAVNLDETASNTGSERGRCVVVVIVVGGVDAASLEDFLPNFDRLLEAIALSAATF